MLHTGLCYILVYIILLASEAESEARGQGSYTIADRVGNERCLVIIRGVLPQAIRISSLRFHNQPVQFVCVFTSDSTDFCGIETHSIA